MVRMSTGLKDYLLGTGSFISAFDLGVIELYTGSQPVSPNNAPSGTLLGKITAEGGPFVPGEPGHGLSFEIDSGTGTVFRATLQNWVATFTASGTVGWWRLKANAIDTDQASSTALRLDGALGGEFNQLYLPEPTVASGSSVPIELFSLTFS